MLDPLVAAKENCFRELFKTIKTVRISKFIRQRVPDCHASIVTVVTAALLHHTSTVINVSLAEVIVEGAKALLVGLLCIDLLLIS